MTESPVSRSIGSDLEVGRLIQIAQRLPGVFGRRVGEALPSKTLLYKAIDYSDI